MRLNKFSFVWAIALSLFLAFTAAAQTETFSNENVDYTFDIPTAPWKLVAKPSTLSPNVEYVLGNRRTGYFQVRQLEIKSDESITDAIRDTEQSLQFLRGYVAGKEENFRGALSGKIFNFEYVERGEKNVGRFYFLQADAETVYLLRFMGISNAILSARPDMDSIARSFKIEKKPIMKSDK
jgi:hypothetical protein